MSIPLSARTGQDVLQHLLAQTGRGMAILRAGLAPCQPQLVEAALPALRCSCRDYGPETGLACLASLGWARSMPLGSGTLAEFWRGL